MSGSRFCSILNTKITKKLLLLTKQFWIGTFVTKQGLNGTHDWRRAKRFLKEKKMTQLTFAQNNDTLFTAPAPLFLSSKTTFNSTMHLVYRK